MPQLPPKIPTNTMSTTPNAATPTWDVDEFLNFTTSRRAAHRRSISDSIAFLEAAYHVHGGGGGGFEKIDDEQLMSMFSDEFNNVATGVGGVVSASSEEDKDLPVLKSEPESPPSLMPAPPSDGGADQGGPSCENFVDPKRVKRILANRQSAQRSRVRKLQYISDLERSVTTLQTEVSTLSPRVAFLDHQRLILNVDNSALKQRIAALAQDKIFKDAHQEALKKEIERLRQIYHQQQEEQNLKKMNINNNNNSAITEIPSYSSPHTTIDKEQLMT